MVGHVLQKVIDCKNADFTFSLRALAPSP